MFKFSPVAVAAAVVVAVMVSVAAHAAMTVQPVILDLRMAGRQMGGQIRVQNTGTTPLPVEVKLLEADLLPDTVKASNRITQDLVAFPTQAIIPAGATQAFRVQYVGNPDADRSHHYYAEISQQPVELPGGQSTIQILYNFQAMVNVASVTAGNPNLTIEGAEIKRPAPDKAPQIAFTVHNSGKNYGYISNSSLTFVQRDASGKEVFRKKLDGSDIQQMIGFGLVGPETSRTFVAPIDLASAEGKVEVTMSGRGK